MNAASPVRVSERIDAIDILRGMALFGVLTVNLLTEFRVSIFQQFLGPDDGTTADRWLDTFASTLIEMKAFAVFSVLFGIGMAIQYERIARRESPLRLLTRRLIVLLGMGLIHLCFIWNGDILTEYALAGFIVLPFLFASTRVMAWGFWIALMVFFALPLMPDLISWPSLPWLKAHVVEATQIYGQDGYWDVVRYNLAEIPSLFPLHASVFPRTVALFLLGAWVWHKNILRDPASNRTLLGVTAIGATALGMVVEIASINSGPALGILPRIAGAVLTHGAPIVLALGYSAAVIYLVEFTRWRAVLAWVGPLGRMAFTNYIVQSLVFGWIFFGYGLGLLGKLGTVRAMGIGIAVYVVQVLYSRWWLRRFRFGPIEWLWRSLMYGRRQPMAVSALV